MIPPYVWGPIAPVFSIFHEDGSLDEAGQRRFLDFLFRSGHISAYFVRSGMGQMFTFDLSDAKRLIEAACDHLRDRAPVLAGTSGIWNRDRNALPDPERYTQDAVELSRHAERCGAAGVVLTLPEAIAPKPGQSPVDVSLDYFKRIDGAVNVDVFIYQCPGLPDAYCVTPQSLAALAALPNVKGIKVNSTGESYLAALGDAVAGTDFALVAGDERGFLTALRCGARAVIGQGAALNPVILKCVQQRFEAGDPAGARAAQEAVDTLVEAIPSPVEFLKRYATEQGYDISPYPRPDLNPAYSYAPMRDKEYERCKFILEHALERFAPAQ